MKAVIRPLAVVAAFGMFMVLVMGATVTNTGSEHGCGRSWPLCQGKFVPELAMAPLIEFSHRISAGLETVIIVVLAAACLYLYRERREIQVLSGLMVLFVFLQAGLGAWAVMQPQLAVILALHFGVSLVAFASVLLTAIFVFEVNGSDALRDRPIPRSFRRFAWAVAGYTYVVVYLGAYVRHAHSDLACIDWPQCNGAWYPGFTGAVGAVFLHRVAAGLLALLIVGLVSWTWRMRVERPDLVRASLIALGMVILQALSGAVVVFTRLDIFSALAHAALAGLLFGSLSYLCLHVLPRRLSAAPRPVLAPHGSGAAEAQHSM